MTNPPDPNRTTTSPQDYNRSTNHSSHHMSVANLTNCISVKLNGDNYLIWKHQMLNVLKMLGLLSYIDIKHPQPDATSNEFDEWTKLDGYVSVCINATLDQSMAHLAIDAKTASQLWNLIEDSYLQQAFAKRSYLQTQYQTAKQGTCSIQTYCDNIKRIADSLKAIGDPISESNLVLKTLHG